MIHFFSYLSFTDLLRFVQDCLKCREIVADAISEVLRSRIADLVLTKNDCFSNENKFVSTLDPSVSGKQSPSVMSSDAES